MTGSVILLGSTPPSELRGGSPVTGASRERFGAHCGKSGIAASGPGPILVRVETVRTESPDRSSETRISGACRPVGKVRLRYLPRQEWSGRTFPKGLLLTGNTLTGRCNRSRSRLALLPGNPGGGNGSETTNGNDF